jgi:hypothetical protein
MAINKALSYGSGDLNPHYFQLPPLMSYIFFVLYGAFYIIGRILQFFTSPDCFLKLYLSDPSMFILIARISMGLIPGVLSVFLIYKLTAMLSDKKTAYISAFLLSVSFLHVRDSHYAYHCIPLSLFLIMVFMYIYKYINTRSTKDIIMAGLIAGIATGFKYNGAIIIIPAILTPFLFNHDKCISFRTVKLCFWFLGVFCMSYFLTNPYSLVDYKYFLESCLIQKQAHSYVGFMHHIVYSAFEGMGVAVSIFSIAGFFIFVSSKDKRKKLMAIFVILAYFSIAFAGQVHERYLLPLLPFLIIMAGFTIKYICFIVKNKRLRIFMFIFLIVGANYAPLAKSVYSDILFTRKDSRIQATEWILLNIPANSRIAMDHSFFSPKLRQSAEQISQKIDLLKVSGGEQARIKKAEVLRELAGENQTYNTFFLSDNLKSSFMFSAYPTLSFDIEELLDNKIKYVVLHLDYPHQKYKYAEFENKLLDKAKLIMTFDPFKNGMSGSGISTTAAPFKSGNVFSRKRNGPIFFIYELH